MVEQHTVETLAGAKACVTFQIAGESTASEYQKVVKKYAKSIELKGFRKGKAPVDLLERKFGKEFRLEAFQSILEASTQEILPSLEPKPLAYSQPHLCDKDGKELEEVATTSLIDGFQPGQALQLSMAFDIAPEIPTATLEDLDFKVVKVTIEDKDVDAEIEQLRKQNGVMVERKDGAGLNGDILSMQFALLDGEQTEPDDSTEKLRTIVRIGEPDAQGFHDKVKGLVSGETKVLEQHSFPDEDRVEEPLRGLTGRVWLQVSSIRTRELPKLDDDFAQDIDEAYQTLADLKRATRDKLEHEVHHVIENYGLLQIYQHWAETLDFAIPRSMVAYQTQSTMDNIKQRMGGNDQGLMMYLAMQHGGDVEKGLQALKKEALLGLFVDLVRQKLLKGKNWQASDEDVDKELEHAAKHQGKTAAALKEQYKDQWEQIKDSLRQTALSSRLSAELIEEATKVSKAKAEELTISELREELAKLETICQDEVFQKFSPFAVEAA